MINFIFVINNDGDLMYGWRTDEIENYIEKKIGSSKEIFAPMINDYLTPERRSKAAQEVLDAETTVRAHSGKTSALWVTGNTHLLQACLDVADKLYITQIDRFGSAEEQFVPFGDKFTLVKKGKLHRDNHGVVYQHQVWYNNKLLTTTELQES